MIEDKLTQLQRIRLEAVALVLHKNPTLDDRYVAKKAEYVVDYIRYGYAEPNKEATNEAPDGHPVAHLASYNHVGEKVDLCSNATPWQETPQGALVKLCAECRDINNG